MAQDLSDLELTLDHLRLDKPHLPLDRSVNRVINKRFLTEQFAKENLHLNWERAREIAKNTSDQRDNLEWFNHRSCRLTASRFSRILQIKDFNKWMQNVEETTLRNILERKDLGRIENVQLGIKLEPVLIQAYKTLMPHVRVDKIGLLINPKIPHLGATPDGLLFDEEAQKYGVLEVKACASLRKRGERVRATLENGTPKGFPLVLNEDGSIGFNRKHGYFWQVLGQLAISGLDFADFVYSSCLPGEKPVIVRIRFSQVEPLWIEALQKLNLFYEHKAIQLFTANNARQQ